MLAQLLLPNSKIMEEIVRGQMTFLHAASLVVKSFECQLCRGQYTTFTNQIIFYFIKLKILLSLIKKKI